MRHSLKSPYATAIILSFSLTLVAQTNTSPRGITPEDYYSFEFLSDPRISPDGKLVAFVMTKIDRNQNRRTSTIWMAAVDNSRPPWSFTTSPQSSSSPRWSPDGQWLAFTSSRPAPDSPVTGGGSPGEPPRAQVYLLSMDGGEARRLTNLKNGVTGFQWSPGGQRIAFVSNRTGKEYDENRNNDVWVMDAEGGSVTKISDHDEADGSPRWSPDGKTIAFTGEVHERDHPKIWLAPATGGTPSVLAANGLDLIPTGLDWLDDGRSIYFETGVKGENQLFRVELATKSISQVTRGPRAVRNVDLNWRAQKIVYSANDFKHLDDLYVADLDGRNERKLTQLNDTLWKQLELADVERFTYQSADNFAVDGFLVKPIRFQADKKYAMILSVHGGPAGMYGVDWFHEFQVYAAKGWAVLYTNPRGSTGYGQKFERAIVNEWGAKDYVDIMNGVDEALKRYPWIDAGRLGVTGGSYGGFMTNWIVGHTNRFKAAVTLRSVSNFISDEGTRDGAYGHKADFGGDLFEKFDTFWDRSPLKFAKNVKTPTLILHSDNDYRVPLEQGEQWFRALKHFGVTTEIVMFPRENHNLTRTGEPKHLVESLNWQLYWFDRFLNGNTNAVPPDMK